MGFNYPINITSSVAFSIGGKGYVGTGFIDQWPGILNTAEFWEYTP